MFLSLLVAATRVASKNSHTTRFVEATAASPTAVATVLGARLFHPTVLALLTRFVSQIHTLTRIVVATAASPTVVATVLGARLFHPTVLALLTRFVSQNHTVLATYHTERAFSPLLATAVWWIQHVNLRVWLFEGANSVCGIGTRYLHPQKAVPSNLRAVATIRP